MKISESWLREWVNPSIGTDELVAQLTMAGLEVDAVESVAGDFTGVIVGEIIACEQHPDADKLRVCQVAGLPDGPAQVVCGAANARVGIKIPFATIGAQLPGASQHEEKWQIKKAKLRGVESFGMLCGQTELKAGDDDTGLWELPADAPVGTNLREYLNLDDKLIEVDLTPNRSDCLSLKGLAREVGVLNRAVVSEPTIHPVPAAIADTFPVALHAGSACSRYVGRVIRNIDITRPSPAWLQDKLVRSGLRSIDAVVDVTNYVLIELGQPMHAFDLSKLQGGVQVRLAEQGEPLQLLDDQEIKLNADTLVIADSKGALAIAGIMGGKASAVSAETRDIFLESAFFNPLAIAGRARSYGLHTDSSHRFERGVDYQLQVDAIERATQLLLDIVGGEAGPVVHVANDELPQERQVSLRKVRIVSGLSLDIADSEVVDILTRLGLKLLASSAEGWIFAVPSYRFDIAIEADLLEELARVYGYNRLPTRSLAAPLQIEARPEAKLGLPLLRRQLIARDYQEAITYSFIEPKLSVLFDPQVTPVGLRNPISADMAVMRTSLFPGLVNVLRHNLNRQQTRVRLFESGLRFVPGEQGLQQEPVLAGLIYGSRAPEAWANTAETVDFFDIKGDLEALLAITGDQERFSFKPVKHSALHPGQTAGIYRDGELLGVVGALHPSLQQQLDLPLSVYLFEVHLGGLLKGRIPAFSPLSRFPEVRRDLALLVARDLPADILLEAVKTVAGELLVNLKIFDVYMGKGIDPQRKSIAVGLTFQHPSRTLNEDEINASIDAVVKHLEVTFSATLR
ncbi:phenylalanine--tRNA ligase subunit beta [Cellvibrio japonicus]|uniref:Phenylalanine--tRNA ligase beta subunit n=1 Tax=Cellvibrio japonicus (strain Ueda107) TaxID=498211 RepID=B3PL11_CELJU|nr:phenylalanine--tRNA ligase subunit beta [Cellvibrio japonicus]ACE85980.1 phenylalanyl-tRNA synthetase, beta subunit [Cellvibrio japonicus Ueda107]QEI12904.1 phenylalanine--tRNA ligase subunit beta [Cellvibrio japonicus]QEI16478.1 phenylalanine--tRNA ligase subunit beta [Cellvibrio japonicus]QEI20056.1 phenylalanine--tRNA ligase subunit beta [Cellvibrio japonicus]